MLRCGARLGNLYYGAISPQNEMTPYRIIDRFFRECEGEDASTVTETLSAVAVAAVAAVAVAAIVRNRVRRRDNTAQ